MKSNTSILRLPQVKQRVGLGRSSIYALLAEKKFPAPVALSARAVGWVESEVEDWISQRIEASRVPAKAGAR